MRILVTGASGFVGSHLARHLVRIGHKVVATGRTPKRLAALNDTSCEMQIADLSTDNLAQLLGQCEGVVHCAARAAPWGDRSLFWRDNVVATERLVAAARRAGSVRRFVYLSSPSIYFRQCDQINLTERFAPPKRWATPYAETKWAGEQRVLAASEIGPVILRPRAVFGPRDTAIVPRIVAVARSGRFPLPGGGEAWTDITYVDNVVAAILEALNGERNVEGRTFNLTNGEPIQIRDLLNRLVKALDLRVRFIVVPRALAMTLAALSEQTARMRCRGREPRLTSYGVGLLSYTQTLSIEAARHALGYRPKVSIDEGLARYARWWKSQV
jgi:nucleoside-diphosphate-sugar epimerase